MEKPTYDKTGYYNQDKFAFSEEDAYDYLLKEYSEGYEDGTYFLKIPSEEFKGLNYENIVTWAASIDAEKRMDDVKHHMVVNTNKALYYYHKAGDPMPVGWFTREPSENPRSYRVSEGDYEDERAIARIFDYYYTFEDLIQFMKDNKIKLPSSEEFMETLTKSKTDVTDEEGDCIDVFDYDDTCKVFYKAIARHIIDNKIMSIKIGNRNPWKYGTIEVLDKD